MSVTLSRTKKDSSEPSPSPFIQRRIITGKTAHELNKIIQDMESEGWKTVGSHLVVETHHQNRFRGSELVDTIIQSEYSITIEK